jgi:hypothetical protein
MTTQTLPRPISGRSSAERRTWPSSDEIRQRCRQIQQEWSPDERLRRAGVIVGQKLRLISPEERLLQAMLRQAARDARDDFAA